MIKLILFITAIIAMNIPPFLRESTLPKMERTLSQEVTHLSNRIARAGITSAELNTIKVSPTVASLFGKSKAQRITIPSINELKLAKETVEFRIRDIWRELRLANADAKDLQETMQNWSPSNQANYDQVRVNILDLKRRLKVEQAVANEIALIRSRAHSLKAHPASA